MLIVLIVLIVLIGSIIARFVMREWGTAKLGAMIRGCSMTIIPFRFFVFVNEFILRGWVLYG